MANVMFAQPDRGTAVIEIVGSAREFRSHYLGGFTAALSYYHVPRLCLAPTAHNHNLAVVNHAWGKVLPRGTGAGGLSPNPNPNPNPNPDPNPVPGSHRSQPQPSSEPRVVQSAAARNRGWWAQPYP
jgi:hypothetical protein